MQMLNDDCDFEFEEEGYDVEEIMFLDEMVRTKEEPSGSVGCLVFFVLFLVVNGVMVL